MRFLSRVIYTSEVFESNNYTREEWPGSGELNLACMHSKCKYTSINPSGSPWGGNKAGKYIYGIDTPELFATCHAVLSED